MTTCACAAVHVDELDMEKIAFFSPPLPFSSYSLSITHRADKKLRTSKKPSDGILFSGDGKKNGAEEKNFANEMKAFTEVAIMLICLNACRRVQSCKAAFFFESISNAAEPVLLILKQIMLLYLKTLLHLNISIIFCTISFHCHDFFKSSRLQPLFLLIQVA